MISGGNGLFTGHQHIPGIPTDFFRTQTHFQLLHLLSILNITCQQEVHWRRRYAHFCYLWTDVMQLYSTYFPLCEKISWLAARSLFMSAGQTREYYHPSHLTLSKTENSKSPFQSTKLLLCDASLEFQVNINCFGEKKLYSVQKISD